MAEEKIFLNRNKFLVSISRVNISGTTYSTANITSVSKRVEPPNRGCAFGLVLIGGIVAMISLAAFIDDSEVGMTGLALGIVALAIGIVWLRSLKPTYKLIFASASGESEAHSSQDESLIDEIVAAVNDAIIARG